MSDLLGIVSSFLLGSVLVLTSARFFLQAAQQFSARARLSPLIVGTLVMSLGATLPELSVTLAAIYQGDPGLAIGNAVGSVIVNIGLLFGLACAAGRIRIGTHKTQIQAGLLFIATGLLVSTSILQVSVQLQATTLLAYLAMVFGILIALSWHGRNHEDVKVIRDLLHRLKHQDRWSWGKIIGVCLASVVGLGLGSWLVVSAVEGISLVFGLSTTLLGLTLTALTTSLPEIVITFSAGRKHEEKTMVGTLIGSSIINLTLFPGLVALTGVSLFLPSSDLLWLLAVTSLFVFVINHFKGRVVDQVAGLSLATTWLLFVLFQYFGI